MIKLFGRTHQPDPLTAIDVQPDQRLPDHAALAGEGAAVLEAHELHAAAKFHNRLNPSSPVNTPGRVQQAPPFQGIIPQQKSLAKPLAVHFRTPAWMSKARQIVT
jgi:hypothetical protein